MINLLTVIAKVFSDTLMFCCKNVSSKIYSYFSSKKVSMYLLSFKIEILTSHQGTTLLSFDQLGSDVFHNKLVFEK